TRMPPSLTQRAERAVDDALELHLHPVLEPELRERRRHARLVEQTQDDSLTGDRRQHGDAEVDRAAGRRAHAEATVLRATALCEIEAAQHLDARDCARRLLGG